MTELLADFIKNEEGQGLVEYAPYCSLNRSCSYRCINLPWRDSEQQNESHRRQHRYRRMKA